MKNNMRENLRKGISLALDLTMRAIAWKDESSAYFYGRVLGRHGLLWIDLHPEVYHYPEARYRRFEPLIIDQKMLAANDKGD